MRTPIAGADRSEDDLDYPFASRPPHEAVERLRRIAVDRPMTKVTMPYGGDVWIVHRHHAARDVLSDPRFVRAPFRTGERVVPYYVPFPDFLRRTIQFEDPPEQTTLRRVVQKGMSPRRVREMRDSAVAFANDLIDHMVESGSPVNLVPEYSIPLPIQMLSNLLGVPPADRPKFERWSSATLAVADKTIEEVESDMAELRAYMADLVTQRRREPHDDLLSDLANARERTRPSPTTRSCPSP